MTSEQTPDRSPARRRMAGYTPPAAPAVSRPGPGTAPDPTAAAPEPAVQEPQSSPVSAPAPVEVTGRESSAPATGQPARETSPRQQAPGTTAARARKRRMAGAPAPAVNGTAETEAETEAAATDSATTRSKSAASAPATKTRMGRSSGTNTRMGGAAAAKTGMGGAPASTVQAEAPQAPVAKARMGGTVSAPGAQTRVGGASAAPAAATEPAVAAPTGAATRMGAPASSSAAPPSRAASTPSTTSTPSGRAGTPGAAGAATPNTGRPAWVKPVAITAGLVVVALAVVLGARWLRTLEGVQEFIATYDGHASQPATAPEGIPGWLGWQHFLNMFFIVLIIRTGLAVRTERKPPGYWTAKPDSFFSPKGNTPKKVSLSQWLHQSLDVLWVANGIIFVVLLVVTGHWARIVPTSWDVVPNMVSGAIQYASLDWPVENGWVHYNALQVMAYFTTVFIAAPLAILTGIRISTWWPERIAWLNRAYPVEWARAVHFPVMLYFVAFTIVHVFLVFFTGALVNLNHMYTSRDVVDWWGLVIFLASLVVIAAAWFLTKPLFTTPIAARMGKVTK